MISDRGPRGKRMKLAAAARGFPRMNPKLVPKQGWVREIRDALGISQSQLAARAGIARATVQQMERAEGRRRITLASLDRLAQAMECQVAFAIVPKSGTLQDVRARQALARAELLLKEKLEASPNPNLRPRELARRKERLAAKLLRGSRRRLWRADTRPAGKKIVKPPRRSSADSQTPQR
jgi:predicted DNA-binding mobile mystery protein A